MSSEASYCANLKVSKTILCVDDCPCSRLITKKWLEKFDLSFIEADCGYQGFSLFVENQNHILAVITDGRMSNGDGRWLARQIKSCSSVPVVLLSGEVSSFESGLFYKTVEKLEARLRLHSVIQELLQQQGV